MADTYRSKIAAFLYWCLVSGGTLAIAFGVIYAIWLFRTDPSWAFAKVIGLVLVGWGVIASIADWLFDYTQAARRDRFTP